MTGDSCDNDNGKISCGSRGNNIKLFNHGSDSRRNNAFRFRGYNENSVNNSKLNRTGVVDRCMHIPLALIAFSNDVNLENFLFGAFIYVILVGVLALNIIPRWV